MKEYFFVPNFDYLPSLVYDCPDKSSLKSAGRPLYDINEILITNLGSSESNQDPYIFVRKCLLMFR
jgi:hypothetical protein